MHLRFFIRVTRIKKVFSTNIKNLLSQNDLKVTEEPSFTEFKNNNHTSYDQTPSENRIDLTTGELKHVKENVQKSKEILDRQTESIKNAEKYLDSTNHKEWKGITPYLLNFHMKYKESVFELEEFDISTKYMLGLVTRVNSKLSYKDKIQNTFGSSKYSFMKHLNGQSLLHFYHHRCELKLQLDFFRILFTKKSILLRGFAYIYNPVTETIQTPKLFQLF